MEGGKKVFFNLTELWKYDNDKHECVIGYCTFEDSEIEEKKIGDWQEHEGSMKKIWNAMKCKKSKNNPPQYSIYTPSLKYIYSDNTN